MPLAAGHIRVSSSENSSGSCKKNNTILRVKNAGEAFHSLRYTYICISGWALLGWGWGGGDGALSRGTWAGLGGPVPHVHGQREVEAQLALASPAGPVARLPELRAPVQGGGWRKWAEMWGNRADCAVILTWRRGRIDGERSASVHGWWNDRRDWLKLIWEEDKKWKMLSFVSVINL